MQKVIKAVKAGDWTAEPDGAVDGRRDHAAAGRVHEKLVAADAERTAALPGNAGLVCSTRR